MDSKPEIMERDLVEDWASRLTQYNVRLTREEGQRLCRSHLALFGARPDQPPAITRLPIGTKIRFTKTLDGPATGDHPAFLYATTGEEGEITGYNEREGYWAKTSRNPPFGTSPDEFEVAGVAVTRERAEKIAAAQTQAARIVNASMLAAGTHRVTQIDGALKGELISRIAAALAPPLPERADDYVGWCRYVNHGQLEDSGAEDITFEACGSDDPGAFKVYRALPERGAEPKSYEDALRDTLEFLKSAREQLNIQDAVNLTIRHLQTQLGMTKPFAEIKKPLSRRT